MKKASPLPIQIVMIATALALALIISLGVFVWTSIGAVKHLQVKTVRMQELTAELSALNEAVPAVARLAIAEPADALRKRYQFLSERRLRSLRDMNNFDPPEEIGELRTHAENICRRMAEVESRAFVTAAGGDPQGAGGLLTSAGYDRDHHDLASLATQMSSLLHSAAEDDLESQERLGRLVILSVAVAIDGQIYQDALLEPIGADSEVHILPQIAGG